MILLFYLSIINNSTILSSLNTKIGVSLSSGGPLQEEVIPCTTRERVGRDVLSKGIGIVKCQTVI